MRLVGAGTSVMLLLAPYVSHAAVVINEIAWMGTVNSANDEWIELYNNGDASVSLEGWNLIDSDTFSIELAGAIGAGEFAVLERTDDTSAPGNAFMTYTGGLSNTGSTRLRLIRSDSGEEDAVSGGEDWTNIGGDNQQKHTAQRTSAGWITAVPTPGSTNATVGTSAEENESSLDTADEYTTDSSSSERNEKVPVGGLRIKAPTRAYVNQPVEFDVAPVDDTKRRLVRYEWSFGDTGTSSAKSPEYTYRYAGNYVVMVESYYAKEYIRARHEIVVLPAQLVLARAENGDIQIHNDAPYEVDISNFRLRGQKVVTIPDHTIVLAGSTLTVPRNRIHYGMQSVTHLYDPEGERVATHDPWRVPPPASTGSALQPPAEPVSAETTPSADDETVTEEVSAKSERNEFGLLEGNSNPEEPMVFRQSASALDAVGAREGRSALPYVGLVGVLLLGIFGVYVRGNQSVHEG